MEITSPLARAGQWFLNSGIQTPEGGVARFYRSDIGKYHPVSTEITGYTASAYAYLYRKTRQAVYCERALHTARFLTRQAWDPALRIYAFEYPEPSPAYFFDCGIIVRGLLAVWRMSHQQEFLDGALACARAMIENFDAGADFHPILELPSKTPAPREARWSRSSGCYQLKAALGWHELAIETGDSELGRQFERLLAFAKNTEADFLPGSKDENRVMDRLHAYCYYLEALVATGGDAGEGIARVSQYLEKIRPRFVRSDVCAQLLRVKLLSGETGDLLDIESFQAGNGGYWFGAKGGTLLPFMNPVSTAFCLQAREMLREFQAGTLERDYRELI